MSDPSNPVNSNFNMIMKQIMQLKHENRELKQLFQYRSDSFSPHTTNRRVSHLSAKSVNSLSKQQTFDNRTSDQVPSRNSSLKRRLSSNPNFPDYQYVRNSSKESREQTSSRHSIRKTNHTMYEVEFMPEQTTSDENNTGCIRVD